MAGDLMMSADQLRATLRRGLHADPTPEAPPGTALAAVLVPVLAAEAADPRVVFTKRTETLSRHAGEISFPGGLADPGELPSAAALREVQEELGLRPSEVEVLGALPSVHTHVSGILIVPFVGLLWRDPRYTPNAAEIADVLEFPLTALRNAGREPEFEHEGSRFRTFVYEMEGHLIWGATGRILWSFFDELEQALETEEGRTTQP
jgi:8-oxo-dGTP pyrophosphatase MutT (NUDIX family)